MQKSALFIHLGSSKIKAALAAGTVISFLFLSHSYAFETSSIESAISQAPTVDAVSPQNSKASETAIPSSPGDSTQDFLNDTSPLSQPTASSEPENIAFTEIQGQGKQCSATGGSDLGTQSCLQRNADGSFAEVESQWEVFGNQTKKQIITKNYNAHGDQISEETLRVKIDHHAQEDGALIVEKETMDIVKQPVQGLTTRDLIVKNYEKGSLVKTTWAHYVENPNIGSLKASIAHHAVLYYEDGKLNAGFANKYKNGRVDDVLLNYNPKKNPNLRIELTGIMQWASWIDQLVQSPLAAI